MIKLLLRVAVLLLACFVMSGTSFAYDGDRTAGAGYVDNKDGTVTDTAHGLMWQQGDDGTERVWQDAGKYCDELELAGNTDWRLPAINLLEGLIEPANSPTAPVEFSVKPSYYWSASESHNNSQSAKYVNFFYGNTYAYSKDNTYYVICVRETAKGQDNNLTASFAYDRGHTTTDENPLEVRFTSEIAGGSAPYFIEWDFGDGETSSIQLPIHVFASSGSYKVLLTVSDNDGAVTSASKEVVLSAPGTVVEETVLSANGPGDQDKSTGEDVSPPVNEVAAVEDVPVAVDGDTSTQEKVVESGEMSGQLHENEGARQDEGEVNAVNQGDKDTAVVGSGGINDVSLAEKTGLAAKPEEVTSGEFPLENLSGAVEPVADTEMVNLSGAATAFLEVTINDENMTKVHDLGHGLLAFAFSNAMRGDADWNKDGLLTSSEVKEYLTAAVNGLSQGDVQPVINFTGKETDICAPHGSTYLLATGVNIYHDDFTPRPFVEQDIAGIQQAIANKCTDTKTAVITGEHANRAEFLQSLKKIGGMIGPNDQLIFYFAGLSERQGTRLNLLFNDTIKGMTAFTGLFYDDIVDFLKGVSGVGTVVLLETSDK